MAKRNRAKIMTNMPVDLQGVCVDITADLKVGDMITAPDGSEAPVFDIESVSAETFYSTTFKTKHTKNWRDEAHLPPTLEKFVVTESTEINLKAFKPFKNFFRKKKFCR